MATARRRAASGSRTTSRPGPAPVDIHKRLKWEYIDLNDITPYPYNARDNEKAIPAVAESIRNFGFLMPCVIDDNNVLVAGHTRTEAAKLLGMTEVPCIRASHLTQEQVNQFRLIDNKVSEIATWDFDLLAGEISKLADTGLDWTKFGWTQEEVDCFSEVVAADCLEAAEAASQAVATAGTQSRRSPTTARFVLGEHVFFLPISVYRTWIDGLRQLHDFNELAITNDIKRRLGIVE